VNKLSDYLRISEAAEYLGVSPNTLRNWQNAGKIAAQRHPVNGHLQTGPFGSQPHSYEYVTEGIPVVMPRDITGKCIFTDLIARVTKFKADSMARHQLRLNDVVFSRRKDLSRAAAIPPTEGGWICGTGCFLHRCSPDRLDTNGIALQYVMPHVQRQVDANAVGSKSPSLNNVVIEWLHMLMPYPSEQAEIRRRVFALESVHENLSSELHKLSSTKSSLMQDLLTGKVRVKVDEHKEITAHV
jgi:type I restriction enzyme S subunit